MKCILSTLKIFAMIWLRNKSPESYFGFGSLESDALKNPTYRFISKISSFAQILSMMIEKNFENLKNEGPSGNMNLDCSNNVVYFYVTVIISLLQFTLFLDSPTILGPYRTVPWTP